MKTMSISVQNKETIDKAIIIDLFIDLDVDNFRCSEWHQNGVIHRENFHPAALFHDQLYWYEEGEMISSDDNPAK